MRSPIAKNSDKKIFLPCNYANRVGRKRNKIRCDPEEKDPMRSIIVEYRSETAKIPPYSTDDIFFRIGGEPEGPVSPAGDGVIDAGIPDLHRQTSAGYVKKVREAAR